MSFHQKTEKGRVKVRICDGGEGGGGYETKLYISDFWTNV